MLTGDKLETATCIAKSSKLVARTQDIHIFKEVATRSEAHQELNSYRRKQDTALVIRGDSLEVCLQYYEHELMELVAAAATAGRGPRAARGPAPWGARATATRGRRRLRGAFLVSRGASPRPDRRRPRSSRGEGPRRRPPRKKGRRHAPPRPAPRSIAPIARNTPSAVTSSRPSSFSRVVP